MKTLKTFTRNTFLAGWAGTSASVVLLPWDFTAAPAAFFGGFGLALLTFATVGAIVLGAVSAVSD